MMHVAPSPEVQGRLVEARKAARSLRSMPTDRKNAVLEALAAALIARTEEILQANAKDLFALSIETAPAFKDRLLLTRERVAEMATSLREVAALPDPVGEVVEEKQVKGGIRARRVRSPLGVILMIFESRPNVAIEAFSLAFKAGNSIILRPGKESMLTVGVLAAILEETLRFVGVDPSCAWLITDPDRELARTLIRSPKFIDVVVPRGGDRLIEFVTANSLIPVIKNDRGMCHVYLHDDCDLAMAESIVENAKTQRPGVCNAMETLLVHRARAKEVLPRIQASLASKGVEWFADPAALEILKAGAADGKLHAATEAAWDTEYLDLKLNCRVVATFDEALAHIELHGSRHSECILTASEKVARRFQEEVDAAAVYWNASTRFTDGFALGLGGELGISTQKLHVRGPVGLRELTSARWVMDGSGQIRG